jgi:GAF domain-containing protein
VTHDLCPAPAGAPRTIKNPADLDQLLLMLAQTTRLALPGFDAVGISTVDEDGNVQTRAATDPLVRDLDDLQYSLGEGPCFETIARPDRTVVVAPRIRDADQWPRYAPQAGELGLRSQLAVRLHLEDRGTVGGLNLYSTTADEVDPAAETMAELFAAQAATMLAQAREIEGLNEALQSRKVIGEAIGLVMKEHTLTEDAAFAYLVRTSSHANVKLRDIAAGLVGEANSKAAH